ncbi:UDP-galactose translocator [Bacillus rossius redtenbacheri]|uniref:UDP-galactose translocator n=1 Tax=Bacillus rossius redtenbacheri TaxID=93214 RepID=UPI002FDD4EDA
MAGGATSQKNALKYVSLVTLTLQNAVLGLSMRYARTRPGDMFLSSTAVLLSEVVKLGTCLVLVYLEEGGPRQTLAALHSSIVRQPLDTLKVCVPSMVYLLQNNLLYVSASHLDAATYQVTYQLKILTTAVFAVLILRRTLRAAQWLSLVVLVAGVVLVQLSHAQEAGGAQRAGPQNRLLGFGAALAACVLSGFAGVYFEKLLKGGGASVWMRNVQLSLLSVPLGLFTSLAYDWGAVRERGFLAGYDAFVWYLVVLQAGGGLLVAVVVKYADNILKGFATSLAIVVSCVASVYLFDFEVTLQFALGAACVICSIFLYNHVPKSAKASEITV